MDLDDITDWFSNLADPLNNIELTSEIGIVFIIFMFVSIVTWGSRLMNPLLTMRLTIMIQLGALLGLIGCIIYFSKTG